MNLNQLTNRIVYCCACFSLASLWACDRENVEAFISVDASNVENTITPWLHGSCIEDVNHEIYGGLYDQKIFGESFEEPVPNASFPDFSVYEGVWTVADGILSVRAYPGAKLVYDPVEIENGSVEVEIKFDRRAGENAGIVTAVSRAGNGADHFYGYEISLAADGKKVVFAKHKHNFEPIREIAVDCNPTDWNRLRIEMTDGTVEVLLNGQSIYVYTDKDAALAKGEAGLRTWHSDVKFRNLKVNNGGGEQAVAFQTTPAKQISYPWDGIEKGDVKTGFALDSKDRYNGNNSQVVEFISGNGVVGIRNAGLNRWGIAVRKGQTFGGRLYLKTSGLQGAVVVALQSADGEKEYARQEITGVTGEWQKYPFELTTNAADEKACFVVYLEQPGKVWIDQVTLMGMGEEQFRGLPLRNDIGQALVDEGLTFLRYGGTMINAPEYRFKKMIGDPDKRPPYVGHWYRYSTNGFGIEDFLRFCEAAGFVASFAINIEETPEDMADMIEYLNGPVTSEWGRKRAENGHPEPYGVKYIGIGNEEVLFNGDRADEYDHYIERFHLLYDAMKSKDPSLSLISTAWWRPDSPSMERVFKALDGKAEYWDYHPWADQLENGKEVEAELIRMKELFHQWNPNTIMKCAIFEENGNLHTMQRVLGHVTVRNAVRRMGDFVLTSCAANALQPYLQNDNGWDQGQIFFTPSQVWGMPPFYAQQMSSRHHQPLRVYSEATLELDVAATRDEAGNKLVLHIANVHDRMISTKLDIAGFEDIKEMQVITLAGRLEDANTPEEPERIVPVEKTMNYKKGMVYDIEPYSYTIVVLQK